MVVCSIISLKTEEVLSTGRRLLEMPFREEFLKRGEVGEYVGIGFLASTS